MDTDPSTSSELFSQWRSPNDIYTILLIIGGEIVQKALAQLSGGYFVPVCFSFGWVSYAFNTILSLVGEGRLMPEPDYACRVINIGSGQSRENHSFVLGRLLLDDEKRNFEPSGRNLEEKTRMVITVYDWDDDARSRLRHDIFDGRKLVSSIVIIVQLVVAALPWILYDDYGVSLVTALGTATALVTGSLHQWRVEKTACRTNMTKSVALTKGNGSKHIMIVRTSGNGLDLEDLACAESPRIARVWSTHGWFKVKLWNSKTKTLVKDEWGTQRHKVFEVGRLPLDFWATRVICTLLFLAWLAVLLTAAGIQKDTWFMLLVGGLGMVQNAMLAASSCSPVQRNIPLKSAIATNPKAQIVTHELEALPHRIRAVNPFVALQKLEELFPGLSYPLLEEFYPAGGRPEDRPFIEKAKEAWKENARDD